MEIDFIGKFASMRIVFMGTPDFSVPSLDKILQAGYEVTAVVTAPDRLAGRGRKLRPSPVKSFALAHGLKVLQPEKLRDPLFHQQLQEASPDLMVVVAFRMLPEVVWSMPRIGTFNLHASLLPDYRGAAPINWVIINGGSQSGATTFLIDHRIDTGNLLLQQSLDIPDHWNAGDLHDALMEMGSDLVVQTIAGLEAGTLTAQPQNENLFIHKAPKIYREQREIHWLRPARVIHNLIRGLSPYPAAWTSYGDQQIKIFASALTEESAFEVAEGTARIDRESGTLSVACCDKWLRILELQMPGKKKMKTDEFLRGFKEEMTSFT